MNELTTPATSRLRDALYYCYDDDELRILCTDLGIDYEDLKGGTRKIKVIELVGYLQRRRRIEDLVPACSRERAHVNWAELIRDNTPVTPPSQTIRLNGRKWPVIRVVKYVVVFAVVVLLGYVLSVWIKGLPTPAGDFVQFGVNSNSDELNPVLKWQQGESKVSSYKLGQRPIVLTAGPWTNQYRNVSTAPLVTHLVKGDFETQVMMVFHPTDGQYAGIGVRSTGDTSTWLRVTRAHDSNGDIVVFSTNDNGQFDYRDYIAYSDDIVHLKIVRQSNLFSLFYSPDGYAWNRIGSTEFNLPDEVEIYLLVLGLEDNIATARFQDFKIVTK